VDALLDDALEQLLKQIRLLEAPVPVLGKGRVVRNLLVETQPGEPAPRQVHAQLLDQLPLTRDAVQITEQQYTQQHFRIDRRPAGFAVGIAQFFANKVETDMAINQPLLLKNSVFAKNG
jgi:hypothetical protein